jgi:sugar/nucleoside kinase (ribokinase family)
MTAPGGIVLGVGSPVVDLLVHVDDAFVATAGGEKGGMELVDAETMADLVGRLGTEPVRAAGGSAGNTIFALARLGTPTGFLGMIGRDEAGGFYRDAFTALDGDATRFLEHAEHPTAMCLSLVTPDGERTMRTNLGAAMGLLPEHCTAEAFRNVRHVHAEGYLLFNPDLILAVLRAAKEAGCTASLDLASFEVVRGAHAALPDLLGSYVDMVFANEDEAEAFAQDPDPEAGLAALAEYCETVAVKLGADGALLRKGRETARVGAESVDRVEDTTGAGDFWAAGFLHGAMRGLPLASCGRLGALLGAAVVQELGAELPGETWTKLIAAVAAVEETPAGSGITT